MDSSDNTGSNFERMRDRHSSEGTPATRPQVTAPSTETAPKEPAASKTRAKASTKDHFSEGLVPAQFA